MFTYCIENGILQDSSEPSNENTNVVNALHEPFVVKQDPGENSSQSPQQINHHCCYVCGDPFEDIFCHQCTCELCGKGAHYGYNCPPKVLVISNPEPCHNQNNDELLQTLPSFDPACYSEDGNSFIYDSTSNLVYESPNDFNPPLQPPIYSYEFCGNNAYYGHDCSLQFLVIHQPIHEKTCAELLAEKQEANINTQPFQYFIVPQPPKEETKLYINTPSWDHPTVCYYDDDEDYAIAVTPSLSTEELDNSLSMGDEHLDTVPAIESDEFIKSSVENLVSIPCESEGIPDNMCDMPFHDNSPPLNISKDQFEDFFDSNNESTSIDDDSFSIDNIDRKLRINTQKKRYYQRCATCGKQVIPGDPIPRCKNHGPQSTIVYSDQANSLTSDCNELLAELIDKYPYHLPSTLKELEDTTHIFQLHFDSESTKRKRDCILYRVFKHQPLPLPAPPVESVTLPSTSHDQPEQMPKPKPASPALSTSTSNEPDISEIDTENLEQPQFIPPPAQEIIAAQKEDKATNLKPTYKGLFGPKVLPTLFIFWPKCFQPNSCFGHHRMRFIYAVLILSFYCKT
nr:hypothetical protein [Tanacetum cinerariifolium]